LCNIKKTADYKMTEDEKGMHYEFFCDLSHASICTVTLSDYKGEEGLMHAWKNMAEKHFNHCHMCHKWVIDAMYNPDVLTCVKCTPIEEDPHYCPKCGRKIKTDGNFCHICGAKLLYGGENNAEKTKLY